MLKLNCIQSVNNTEFSTGIILVFNMSNKRYMIENFSPNRRFLYNELLMLENTSSSLDMSDPSNVTANATTLMTTRDFTVFDTCCRGSSFRICRYL